MDEILLGAEVPLGSLDTRMAKHHLDLLKFGAGCSAEFGARAASVVRRDARNPGSLRVGPEHLPYDLLGECVAPHLVAANDGPEHVAVHDASGGGPRVDGHLNPGGHRNDPPHAPVLPVEVHDTPPAIPLLYVGHRKRRHLRPPQSAAQEHGDDSAVAQALERRDIRRVQERLRLLERQPVAGVNPATVTVTFNVTTVPTPAALTFTAPDLAGDIVASGGDIVQGVGVSKMGVQDRIQEAYRRPQLLMKAGHQASP